MGSPPTAIEDFGFNPTLVGVKSEYKEYVVALFRHTTIHRRAPLAMAFRAWAANPSNKEAYEHYATRVWEVIEELIWAGTDLEITRWTRLRAIMWMFPFNIMTDAANCNVSGLDALSDVWPLCSPKDQLAITHAWADFAKALGSGEKQIKRAALSEAIERVVDCMYEDQPQHLASIRRRYVLIDLPDYGDVLDYGI
jgi:hypothetical protein